MMASSGGFAGRAYRGAYAFGTDKRVARAASSYWRELPSSISGPSGPAARATVWMQRQLGLLMEEWGGGGEGAIHNPLAAPVPLGTETNLGLVILGLTYLRVQVH